MNILALNCGCEIPLVDNVLVPHEIVYIYNIYIYIMYVKTYIITQKGRDLFPQVRQTCLQDVMSM